MVRSHGLPWFAACTRPPTEHRAASRLSRLATSSTESLPSTRYSLPAIIYNTLKSCLVTIQR